MPRRRHADRDLMTDKSLPPCVVFDFDGTLVDSAPGILTAMSLVLKEHGITPRVALEPGIIGPPLLKTLALISGKDDDDALASLAASFKRHYDGQGYRDTVPYEGIDQVLRELKAAGMALMLATNKRGAPTRLILDYLDWTTLFDAVYCLDEYPDCENKGAMLGRLISDQGLIPAATHYVGDTDGDRQAATQNQMPFVYVLWGYGGNSATSGKNISNPTQLLNAIQTM